MHSATRREILKVIKTEFYRANDALHFAKYIYIV